MDSNLIAIHINDELLLECPDARRLVNPGKPGQVVFAGSAPCYNLPLLTAIKNEAAAEVDAEDGTYSGRIYITRRESPAPGAAFIRVEFEFRSF